MFYSLITKNSNWEISTKNLVTFKRYDGVKDEKLQYLVLTEKSDFLFWVGGGRGGGGGTKNQYRGEIA